MAGTGCQLRVLALTLIDRQRSEAGLEYAHPSMMALANLLSHPKLGDHVMSTPVGERDIHRSSKDLGRVLALARLESREETERWAPRWRYALEACKPTHYVPVTDQLHLRRRRWRLRVPRSGEAARR